MLPRRSKRVKTAHEVASKPKAKAASKSKNAKTALKAKDAKKAKPHPNAKKSNTQPASPEIRNGRGALRDLLEMPMDIICEIFYRLRPLELLRVARINKAFRSLLMHRSSTHIWKEARNSMPGLPEPFPGMSEPAFAALCFDSYCHLCSRPQIRDVVWEFRMRLCNQCKDTKTTLYQRPTPQCPVRPPVMTAVLSKGSRRSVLTSEAQETADKWKQLTDEKEKKKFIVKRKSQISELERHAAKCREWFMNFKRDRAQEIEMIKKQRYDDICQRLEKIGYEDDVAWVQYSGYALDTVAVFREAKHVTDQVWANIKPTVTKYFNNHIRPRRVADEYFAFLKHSMPSLRKAMATFARSYGNIFPLCANFANSSEVRELLDPTSEDDIDVDFDLLIPVLPKILDDWRQNVDRRLDTYLRS
ncbi:hypothetical protein QCA50_014117 [Cerrena zonata]|uniref:F-box domain-containing protein n=1 Tax=Cerrena zonata TaxID=2478898 RepID=A0AAW0FX21_9APHY